MGTAATKMGNLNVMGSRSRKGQAVALIQQGQDGYWMGSGVSRNQNSLRHRELWIDRNIPKTEIAEQPTKFMLDMYKQKSSRSKLNHKESLSPSINSQTWAGLQIQNPLNEGKPEYDLG